MKMGENGKGNSAFLKCRILRTLTLEAHEREHDDNDDAINFVYICQLSAMILMQRSNQNNAPDSPSSSCAKSFSFNITAFQIDYLIIVLEFHNVSNSPKNVS